ncbi:alpha/beta hydrolase-fold protein [Actinomyces sp. ZJ308]|uniref:carboxylesterase family protein n=1 Tax=Actinomyces sp. ZJ308 TaxID=2708342 RepID=UPI001FBA5093|nr:alpha/beta hydrolase-fold protein [Actinomyces sp. ZJ308]
MTTTSSAASSSSAGGSTTSNGSNASSSTSTSGQVPTIDELTPLASSFTQSSYSDSETGKSLPFNIFLPEGYDASGSYPLVHFIADASMVGGEVTAPLSQYGALIWAHRVTQDLHKCVVVVPCYPEVVLDDHDGYTTTDWMDVTRRFVPWLQQQYAIDSSRVYGTGQSMGCMMHMVMAAQDSTMFSACMFVDGQWDPTQLTGLGSATWVYQVAGGDDRAFAGQQAVKEMLTSAGVDFAVAPQEWDATASASELDEQTKALFSQGKARNFSVFKAGTVMEANPTARMEHMASFEPAYKLTGMRTWLLDQKK